MQRPGSRPEFLRTSIGVTLTAILGQAPTALVPIALGVTLGANERTDALLLAFAVASFVANALVPAAQYASVPFLVPAGDGVTADGALLGRITTVMCSLAVALSLAAGLASAAALRATDLDPAHRLAATALLWPFLPYVVLTVVAGTWAGALAAARSYAIATLSPAIRSVVVLAFLLTIGARLGLAAVALAYVCGEAVRTVVLYRALRSSGQRIELRGGLGTDARTRSFVRSVVAQTVGSATVASIALIDRFMAAGIGPGSVSILEYVDRLWQIPAGLLMSGFLVVSLSEWTHDLNAGGTDRVAAALRRSATAAFLVPLPICVLVALFRNPLAEVLYAHGSFPQAEVARLGDTLAAYVAGVPFYLAGLAYTRVFLVLKRSDWLLAVSVAELLLKLVLNPLFISWWGVVGIGLANVAMYSLGLVLLVSVYHGRLASPSRAGVSGV